MLQCNIMMHKMLSPEENENIIREAMPKVEQIAELISAGTPLLPDKKSLSIDDRHRRTYDRFLLSMKAKNFMLRMHALDAGNVQKSV